MDELTQEINHLKLNEIVKAREEIETEKAAINGITPWNHPVLRTCIY